MNVLSLPEAGCSPPGELEMLGYTRDEYLGRHIAEFHADPHVIRDILDKLNAG